MRIYIYFVNNAFLRCWICNADWDLHMYIYISSTGVQRKSRASIQRERERQEKLWMVKEFVNKEYGLEVIDTSSHA